MTTYIVTTVTDGGDPYDEIGRVMSEEEAQDMVAVFFADPDEPDGSSITIRRAGYMGGTPARLRATGPSGIQFGNGNVQVNDFSQTVDAGSVSMSRGHLTLIKGGRS